jgi:hypothetical protein
LPAHVLTRLPRVSEVSSESCLLLYALYLYCFIFASVLYLEPTLWLSLLERDLPSSILYLEPTLWLSLLERDLPSRILYLESTPWLSLLERDLSCSILYL